MNAEDAAEGELKRGENKTAWLGLVARRENGMVGGNDW